MADRRRLVKPLKKGAAAPFFNLPRFAHPRIVTAAQKASGKDAKAQIAVTQATLSNAGASWRIFLTNAISQTPQATLP